MSADGQPWLVSHRAVCRGSPGHARAAEKRTLRHHWPALGDRDQLGATIDPPIDIPYRTINRAFDLPADRLHRLATARKDGHIFLELDQYPPQAKERPCRPGGLVPGIGVVTIGHDDRDRVAGPWLSPPTIRERAIYGGSRAGVMRSPEGALFELVERRR